MKRLVYLLLAFALFFSVTVISRETTGTAIDQYVVSEEQWPTNGHSG